MSDHEKMTHERRVDQNALAHAARNLLSKQSIAASVVLELGDGAIVAAGKQDAVLMLLKPSPVAPEQDQAIADATEMSAKYEGGTQLIASLMTEVNDLRERIGHLNQALKFANDCLAGCPAAHIASKPNAEPVGAVGTLTVKDGKPVRSIWWGENVAPLKDGGHDLYATPAASAPTDRNDILEEAAKLCEEIEGDTFDQYKGRGKHAPNNPGRADPYMNGQSDGAGQCANAIRALMRTQATKGE